MPEICVIPPAGEPIHVEEAKLDRRISDTADDGKIRSLIAAARQAAETKTRQQFLHARWQLTLDQFPMAGYGYGAQFSESSNIPPNAVRLPHSPLVQVVSIQYIDMGGTLQTMPSSDYVANKANMPGLVSPGFGKIWPIALPQIGAVTITYDAGYASPIKVAAPGTQFSVIGPVTYAVGARVQFYCSGGESANLPAPLDPDQAYLIASTPSPGVYTLTDLAGTPISFNSTGTDRSFIGVVPDGLRSWMLLRVGSLYENREEVAILPRGKAEPLPYIDSLLDPYLTGLP